MALNRNIQDVANALIEAANEVGEAPRIVRDLRAVEKAFAEDPKGFALLNDTVVTLQMRRDALTAAVKESVHPYTLNTLLILQAMDALDELPRLIATARRLAETVANHREAAVSSAIKLTESELEELSDVLKDKFKGTIDIRTHVDPALLGGVRATIGGTTYDATIKGKLTRLTQALYV